MKKQTYKMRAIYTGRRITGSGTAQRFELLPAHKEIFFRGIKGVYIGYTYKCSSKHMATKPERTDDERIDDATWDAADALVDAENSRKRQEQKIKSLSKPALRAAIDAISPLVKNLAYHDCKNLLEYLLEKIMEKKR